MNPSSSAAPPPFSDSPDSGNSKGFSYGIAFAIIVLIVVTAISLVAYCTRWVSPPGRSSRARRRALAASNRDDDSSGLGQAVIDTYPKLTYAEAKKTAAPDECCSICLSDYWDGEVLRQLPECGHVFHVGCIDAWLRRQPTCPVCRSFSVNTPSVWLKIGESCRARASSLGLQKLVPSVYRLVGTRRRPDQVWSWVVE